MVNLQKNSPPVVTMALEQPEPTLDLDLQLEVNYLNEDLNILRKTDDDINFERITESWNYHSL